VSHYHWPPVAVGMPSPGLSHPIELDPIKSLPPPLRGSAADFPIMPCGSPVKQSMLFPPKAHALCSCSFVPKSSPGLARKLEVLHNKRALSCFKVNTHCLISACFTRRHPETNIYYGGNLRYAFTRSILSLTRSNYAFSLPFPRTNMFCHAQSAHAPTQHIDASQPCRFVYMNECLVEMFQFVPFW